MWWARGELNHSTSTSYLGLYAKLQVGAVVLGRRRPFAAVPRRAVMPRGITDDLGVCEASVVPSSPPGKWMWPARSCRVEDRRRSRPRRVAPSVTAHEELQALLAGTVDRESDIVLALVETVTRLVVRELLEGEQRDLLCGCGRYDRRDDGQVGSHNGHEPGRLRTAEGSSMSRRRRSVVRATRAGRA
jgi:hypothetical protein